MKHKIEIYGPAPKSKSDSVLSSNGFEAENVKLDCKKFSKND